MIGGGSLAVKLAAGAANLLTSDGRLQCTAPGRVGFARPAKARKLVRRVNKTNSAPGWRPRRANPSDVGRPAGRARFKLEAGDNQYD